MLRRVLAEDLLVGQAGPQVGVGLGPQDDDLQQLPEPRVTRACAATSSSRVAA